MSNPICQSLCFRMIRLTGSNPFTINHYICFFSHNMQLLCVTYTHWLKKTVRIFNLCLRQTLCAWVTKQLFFHLFTSHFFCAVVFHAYYTITIRHKDICTVTVSGELSEEDGFSCLHEYKISFYWSRMWEIYSLQKRDFDIWHYFE